MPISTGYEVRQRLCQDHERLEAFLEAMLVALDGDDSETVASAWGRFDREVLAHMDAEERFLIPGLCRHNQREARALLEEHRHIRARLTELGAGVDHHTMRAHTARSFVVELRAHARHEDRVLYEWADENLDHPDCQSLARFLAEQTSPTASA